MKKKILKNSHAVLTLLLCLPLCMTAANRKTSVASVSAPVTISDDVDYLITSTTPFKQNGLVNITNTEHAVVILTRIKPSIAISNSPGNIP